MKPFRFLSLAGLALVALFTFPTAAMAAPEVYAVSQEAVLGADSSVDQLVVTAAIPSAAAALVEQRTSTDHPVLETAAVFHLEARKGNPPRLSRGDPLLDVGRRPGT